MKKREATLIVLSPRAPPARQASAGGRKKEEGRNQSEAEGYLLPRRGNVNHFGIREIAHKGQSPVKLTQRPLGRLCNLRVVSKAYRVRTQPRRHEGNIRFS